MSNVNKCNVNKCDVNKCNVNKFNVEVVAQSVGKSNEPWLKEMCETIFEKLTQKWHFRPKFG